MRNSRRIWLGGALAAPLAVLGVAPRVALAATPECGASDAETVPQMEGPFFKPRSPQRTSLLGAGVTGKRLVLTGVVRSRACVAVAGALLDFWHCDAGGDYDNAGFRLRGHQFTDAAGRFRLETIVPGHYPGRVRHIHVKVQAAGGPVLTTQLYFPDEPGNRQDFLFRPDLLMTLSTRDGRSDGQFDFVIRTG